MEEELNNGGSVQKRKRAGSKVTVLIDRPAFNQARFDEGYEAYEHEPQSLSEKARAFITGNRQCNKVCFVQGVLDTFPILRWLPKYSLRDNLLNDIIAGFTVAIMHIPQGMAYGILAGLPPVNGLYVSFFPVLIYSLMGTSRHISIGTFAVASLMVSQILSQHGIIDDSIDNINLNNDSQPQNSTYSDYVISTNLGIVTSVALLAGIFQLSMGLLRMGFITIYLSDQLVSGFTTGAAVHVASSQLKNLFGLKLTRFDGPLKIIYIIIDFFSKIAESNPAAVIISIICMIFMVVIKDYVNPYVKTKFKMPIPVELLLVILGTVTSYFGEFEMRFGVKIIGHIPTGLPFPTAPNTSNLGVIAGDSFALAMVCFAISVSLAKILAKKRGYDLNANQEMIALGSSTIFSSFFGCYPAAASLSRSMIQEAVGGQTQIAGLISCLFLLIVLLATAPLFGPLPYAILSSIIVVNLKGLFLQFKELKNLWYISIVDFMIWVVSFLAVTLIDLALGLGIAVGFALMTVIIRAQRPHTCLLGRLPRTDIYKDIKVYKAAEEIDGIKVFRFESSLFFANSEYFRHKIYLKSGVNPRLLLSAQNKVISRKKKMEKQLQKKEKLRQKLKEMDSKATAEELAPTKTTEPDAIHEEMNVILEDFPTSPIHHIIIDCAGFTYLDTTGVNTLIQVIDEYKKVGITVFLANCRMNIRHMLNVTGFFEHVSQDNIYVTVHDAVLFALKGTSTHIFQSELDLPQEENTLDLNLETVGEENV